MADSSGWFRTILYFVVGIGCVGSSFYYLTKVPLALFFDILAKQVRISEGRVNAREEEKAGKRDEVITYYFDMKDRRFEVPRPAFNASGWRRSISRILSAAKRNAGRDRTDFVGERG